MNRAATTERKVEEVEFVTTLRARCRAEGGVFWINDHELAVFDAHAAQQVNALNFADLTLPDKLADVVRGRSGDAVSWRQVRAAWGPAMAAASSPPELLRLSERMAEGVENRLDQPLDLVWMAQQVVTQSLLPVVIDRLRAADHRRLLRDQDFKLARLVRTRSTGDSAWQELRSIFLQMSAGRVVRRELRARQRGRRPRQGDLTDPMVELLPELGLDRAMDAVTTVTTAIAGPPGAAAASLLYELTLRPEWAERLTAELAGLPLGELAENPTQRAPTAYRFVKEVLRQWSPPILMTRPVRTPLDVAGFHLEPGQRYLLSTYLIHHDPRYWQDPDTFDPDRWLPGAPNGRTIPQAYVPFGWPPKACLGAALGTAQLILLCHLMLTRYRIELADPDAAHMLLAAVPLPVGFTGVVSRR